MASFKEALRRVYYEMAYRRATVRISSASEAQLKYPPIFIVGVYRSGTTLMRYILDSHSRVCSPPESAFIAALRPIVSDSRYSLGLDSMGFDEDHVVQRLREFCAYFFESYAASLGKPRWADKSPNYVDYLDFLLRLFPKARFVIIYRHGLDQAHSNTRGGTYFHEPLRSYCYPKEDLRIGATRYWSEKTEKILDFEVNHPESCISVRYEDLCETPEQKLRPIFDFIEESWEPRVLEYYRFGHDKGAEDGRVIATRGFAINKDHYRQWPNELVDECLPIAEPTLKRLGYAV